MNLICGMHRSGTSLVARVAFELGADFGDPHGFHPADRWNPDGYFEQREVLALNRKLVNGPWGRAAYFRLPADRTVRARAVPLSDRLARVAESYRDRVVKENRFCLTLGAWRAHGATVDRLLVVLRDPEDVARSLRRRNRIPRGLAFSLWREHHLRLDRAAADLPSACLWYDRWVADEAGAARESEKLAWLLGVDPDGVRRVALDLVRFRNRPPRASPGPGEAPFPPAVSDLYRKLIARCETVS